jgi:5-methylcytosine-specific restriction endonuclease McrBC regulatory subunit McrC
LDVTAQIKFNLVDKHHLACTWNEATIDNPVNQGILAVLDHLRSHRRFPFQKLPNGPITDIQQRVGEIASNLIAANVARPLNFPVQRVRWSRANDRFRTVHRLGQILLEQGRAARPEEDDQKSLLLDSAEIWEMFLFHRLRRALETRNPGLVLSWPRDRAANQDYMLEWNKQRGLLLIPDMIIKNSDGRCVAIIDAKYRYFKRPINDRELACQMALYASNYTSDEITPVMVLVYPSIEQLKNEDHREMNSRTKAEIGTGSLNFAGKAVPLLAWAIDLSCNHNPSEFNSGIDRQINNLIERICTEASQLVYQP